MASVAHSEEPRNESEALSARDESHGFMEKDFDEDTATCSACSHRSQLMQRMKRRLEYQNQVIADLNEEIDKLEKLVPKRKDKCKDTTQPERTWPTLLRDFAAGQSDCTYTHIWRQSNKEENVSVDSRHVHPNVRLIAAEDSEFDEGSESDETSRDVLRPDISHEGNKPSKFERFNDLPLDAQLRIFGFLLKMDRCLIHVFSRLDPYNEVVHPQPRSKSNLPAKFFISDVSDGQAPVSLSNATDPAELLQPLLTCKRWCFYLCHVFYSANTFAFSSFGEFERFCIGIGPARVQRIQHLELYWKGGVQTALGKSSNLLWLREALRLRTLVIWVSETARSVIRRPREPEELIWEMKEKTSGQPNARMTRAMRNLKGLDYILTLRGLEFCRFYNYDNMLQFQNRSRSRIRDLSFEIEINRSVSMEKVPAQAKKAELYRLDPLFELGG